MNALALDLLWEIARGEPKQQDNKIVYPSPREQIAALSFLAKIEGWDVPEKKTPEPIIPDFSALSEEKWEALFSAYQARKHLLSFTAFTFPSFTPAPFHERYYQLLTDFAFGKVKKLMIFMPPQHGKSEGATRRLPPFLLGRNPELKIAITSYNTTKARKFNREIQRIMDDPTYHQLFPKTILASRNMSTTYLRNADECEVVSHQGGFKTLGVGGALTGEPVDVLILDDLYKDALSAWSPIVREHVADWYDTVASTRLHNNSQQLIVFTRWHPDDLAGRLLSHEGTYHPKDNPQGWQVVLYPAIKVGAPSPFDPRTEGEPLWAQRHSLNKLLATRVRNPQVFESLYQQNPQPQEGLMYESFNEYTDLPNDPLAITKAYVDTADTGSDYLCAIIYKETPQANYLLDILYTQEPMEYTEQALASLLTRYQVQECIIESNNGGRVFARNVQARALKQGNDLTHFRTCYQTQNKATRIFTYSAAVQHLTLMPQGWRERFPAFAKAITSYLKADTNPHDDAPDALTGTIEHRKTFKKNNLAALFNR